MHKQLKQILVWLTRKRVLLFVLIFSMALLDSGIYRFAKQNNWLEDEFAKQIQNIGLIDAFAQLNLCIKDAEVNFILLF